MNLFKTVIKAVKRAWFEFQLHRLIVRQSVIDARLLEAEFLANQTRRDYTETTIDLSSKRTTIRTKLIRL